MKKHSSNKNKVVHCLGGLVIGALRAVAWNLVQYKSKIHSDCLSKFTWKFLVCTQECSMHVFVQVEKFSILWEHLHDVLILHMHEITPAFALKNTPLVCIFVYVLSFFSYIHFTVRLICIIEKWQHYMDKIPGTSNH